MRSFPFSALVGQEEMKLSLLLALVNPRVGGVLLSGEKGTGKSTAARALAGLLRGPLVNLPLSATEETLLGHFSLEEALRSGKKVFVPGLLKRAHQGVLYVDEINLLPPHLVAAILDVAESGLCRVEREGLSASYEARFLLIGSMNPEEGNLSPQLLDRFGLLVMIKGEEDPAQRAEIVKRRLSFEKDPQKFCQEFAPAEEDLRKRLAEAQRRLPLVRIPEALRRYIGELVLSARVAGHRADLVLQEAARAHAAWKGRWEVTFEDLEAVAEMVLRHRRRPQERQEKSKTPSVTKEKSPEETPQKPKEKPPEEEETRLESPKEKDPSEEKEGASPPRKPEESAPQEGKDQVFEVGETFEVKEISGRGPLEEGKLPGRRSQAVGFSRGHFLRAVPYRGEGELALRATIFSAAPHQPARGGGPGRFIFRPEDLRAKLRLTKTGHLLLFCVDGSGSMAAEARMRETKGAILSLLLSAYQRRDRVALMVFRGQKVEMPLPPTDSVELAAKYLEDLPVGGSTPLPAALFQLKDFLAKFLRRDPSSRVTVLLITDGRGNVSVFGEHPREEIEMLAKLLRSAFPTVEFVVIDTEAGAVRLEMAKRLAELLGARYFTPEVLKAERLFEIAAILKEG